MPAVGEQYDNFGHVWEVTKVLRREVYARRAIKDPFGRVSYETRSFHVSALDSMRKLPAIEKPDPCPTCGGSHADCFWRNVKVVMVPAR